MKAALEAWGADSNLFHQGAATESDDPAVIAATLKKPGVVLRRAVGSHGSFGERAELPSDLGDGGKPTKAPRKSIRHRPTKSVSRPTATPPATKFVDVLGKLFDATIPYDLSFYESLNRVVQYEPWLPRGRTGPRSITPPRSPRSLGTPGPRR